MLAFFTQYLHIIFKILFVLISVIAIVKSYRKEFLATVSWRTIVIVIGGAQLLYATLLSVLQYMVWKGNAFTAILLSSPLPAEYFRPLLNGMHGYYFFYAYNHFFLGFIITLVITSLCIGLLYIWKRYEPTHFKKGDIFAIAAALLLVSWPSVVILIPAALLMTVLVTMYSTYSQRDGMDLPLIFLITSLIVILIGEEFLRSINLYTLLAV